MYYFFGVIFHLTGGLAAGSFYLPYKKVKNWSWENYWIAGGLFSWIIVPFIAAALTIPNFINIITEHPQYLGWPVLFGLLWGVGGLTYGLGMRYLGMSLGNSVILGFSSAFGALLPPLYYDLVPQDGKVTVSQMLASAGGQMVLLGVLVCIAGIAVSGRAGILKERNIKNADTTNRGEFNLKKGLLLAILSGTLSSCFNYGIEAGRPLAALALEQGANPLFQNNITFLVVLWGGFTTNAVWCIYLFKKNKSFGAFSDSKKPLLKNYIFSALAGTTWFLQFFFYGMGESRLGNGAGSWILHMSTIIITGNLWGLYLKEWSSAGHKARVTMIGGVVILLLSVAIVGYGSSL
ncbi:L-rhamnose/proton symporter RhaT [Flavobacterium psychrotrophum]|uniref:L-rhamnose/proton symporter RhaT n=1 Tax=Flavobacterium psychrotrophum TaxID=2294119 RepID=UPI000E31D742|nr:L-rhamnose/proton symporter RhaT [Flavobacterium psychrotrophum]